MSERNSQRDRGRTRPREERSRSNERNRGYRDNDHNRLNENQGGRESGRHSFGGDTRETRGDRDRYRDVDSGQRNNERRSLAINRNEIDYSYNRGGMVNRGHRGGLSGFSGNRGGTSGATGGGDGDSPGLVEIWTNYFELQSSPNWHLYQYQVDFEPETQSKRLKVALIKSKTGLFPNNTAFDGSTLFTTTRLPDDLTITDGINARDGTKYKISIKKVADIFPTTDNFEIQALENTGNNRNDFIRMLNVIFKKCLTMCGLKEFGRQRAYFDFSKHTSIERYKLAVITGYKATIQIYTNKLLMCCDFAHRLISKQNVFELISYQYRRSSNDFKSKCIEDLVGQTVLTNYNKRTYKIGDIRWDLNPKCEFNTKNGPIKFFEYYEKMYNIKISDMEQPLLQVNLTEKDIKNGRTDLILLIPEFCAITGGSLMKPDDFSFKRELDDIVKLDCQKRYDKLVQLVDTVTMRNEAKQELDKWNMGFSRDVVKLNATVLKVPNILFQNKREAARSGGWGNLQRDAKHIRCIDLKKWAIFFMPRERDVAGIVNEEIKIISRPMGFNVNNARLVRLPESQGNVGRTFTQAIAKELNEGPLQMVVCIIPNNAADTYHAIKKICCIEYGIASQVIVAKTLNKNLKSVLTKVAIQMSCKLGGEVWSLHLPPKKPMMVVGIDVYTDTKTKRTVTAFVSSMNCHVKYSDEENILTGCTRWFSRCMLEEKEQKYSDWIFIMMAGAIDKFKEKNGHLPQLIFVFRDGVSNSEFSIVKEHEVEAMKESFLQIDPAYKPDLIVTVVQKRSSARFFKKNQQGYLTNPDVGTLIDKEVVNKPNEEFYLISQHTNQGTVNPTHYHVIENTVDGKQTMEMFKIQHIAYRLTHLYYNWPGCIRVPAPCHYAHKLAFLVANSLHEPNNSILGEFLFYL